MMLHVIGAKPLHIDMARFVDGDFHHPRIVDKFLIGSRARLRK